MNLKRPPRKEHLFFPFGKSISDPLGHQCGFILDDLAIWILLFCFAISNLCQQTEEKYIDSHKYLKYFSSPLRLLLNLRKFLKLYFSLPLKRTPYFANIFSFDSFVFLNINYTFTSKNMLYKI